MMRGRKGWFRTAGCCAAFGIISSLSPSWALASNFGFWLKTRVYPVISVSTNDFNLLALPAKNAYGGRTGVKKLCGVMNLGPDALVMQIDAGAGRVNSCECKADACQLVLKNGLGVIVTDTAQRDGLVVGSDDPSKVLTIYGVGASPVGRNVLPIDYHTTMVTPQDFCTACSLSPAATVTRFDAQTGNVLTHTCGQMSQWNLVKGEAVLVLEPGGTRLCTPPHY